MIEVELKMDKRSMWANLKHDPKYWLILAAALAVPVSIVYELYKEDFFGSLFYFIKNDRMSVVYREPAFWWGMAMLLFTCVFLPVKVLLTLPPIKAHRFGKRYPDYKSTLVFDEDKMINDYSYKGVKNRAELPYSLITLVTRESDHFCIKLKKNIHIYDDCFINGTPDELGTFLKTKCADKCRF